MSDFLIHRDTVKVTLFKKYVTTILQTMPSFMAIQC